MVFIYGLKCPIADVIRYVGKSINPHGRKGRHISAAIRREYNHHTARWLRKLSKAGLEPELVILHEVGPGERWQDVERFYIATAKERGWRLTNSTAGGEGLDYVDEEARAKYLANLGAAMKRLWNLPERKIEASQRSLKAWADPEITNRRKKSMNEARAKPEIREKHARAMVEVHARTEVKAAHSQSLKDYWSEPATKAERQATINRDKMSASAKQRWADPAKREALLAIRSTEEHRALLAEKARLRATPEYRAMMAEKTRLSWEKRRSA